MQLGTEGQNQLIQLGWYFRTLSSSEAHYITSVSKNTSKLQNSAFTKQATAKFESGSRSATELTVLDSNMTHNASALT